MKKQLLFAAFAAILCLASCTKEESNSVTSVTVTPSELSLVTGETSSLSVSVEPSTAAYSTINWTSSDEAVATISAKGTVTAKGAGTATITATVEGVKGTCTVTVTDNTVNVNGVSLNKETLTLSLGATEVLVATVSPENATDKTVSWSSSDPEVATVDGGIVTAMKAGTATVTVKTNDGGLTASCEVTVKGAGFTSISFANGSSASIVVEQGSETTLNVEYNPITIENKTLSWSSSDESIATVASAGEGKGTVKFTSSKYGAVTITATAEEGGVSASQAFFVKGSEALYILPSGKTAVDQRKTYSFNTAYYTDAANVVWTVGDKTYQGADAVIALPSIGENIISVSAQFGDVTISDSFTVSAEEFLLDVALDNGRYARNTHPVFNKASTRAYVVTYTHRTIQEINLEKGELGWTFDIDDGKANNGPDISVNPVTGDIYACNQSKVFAITAEGTQKWAFDASAYKSTYVFKGTAPAVNNDGSVIAVSFDNHLVTLSAADGTKLDDYSTKGRSQMAFYGDNKMVLHTHNEASGQIRFLSISSDGKITEEARIDSPASPATLSDLATCAVNKEQTRAYFGINGNNGMTLAVDIVNRKIDDYASASGEHFSPCITEQGAIYQAWKNNASKNSEVWYLDPTNLSEGGKILWQFKGNANTVNHQGVCCDREGNAYFANQDKAAKGSPVHIYKIPYNGGAFGDAVAVSTFETASSDFATFQACFSIGDGYLVIGLSNGHIVVRCFDGERGHSWSGEAGDLCGSSNANFAYAE